MCILLFLTGLSAFSNHLCAIPVFAFSEIRVCFRMLAFNTLKVPYARKVPSTDSDGWGEEQQLEISGVAIDMKLSVNVVPMVCTLFMPQR